jgi:hypothetical protein
MRPSPAKSSGLHSDAFAALLDRHRAELNVVIGDFAMWAESFGEWAKVDVGGAIYPPVTTEPPTAPPGVDFESELRRAREALAARRTNVLAALSDARETLRAAGLPVEHLTAYRRVVRLWAGEAVDLVTEAHRLAVADRYLRRLGRLSTDVDADGRTGAQFFGNGCTNYRTPTGKANWPSPKYAATAASSSATGPSRPRNDDRFTTTGVCWARLNIT